MTDSSQRGRHLPPGNGFVHVACPACGEVYQWPVEREGETTYCNHTGRLIFGYAPDGSQWRETVAVTVVRS